MSAIVLNHSSTLTTGPSHNEPQSYDRELELVSLATGTKSLPVSALPRCDGLILHDCHAEILALRGLNYWLLTETGRLLQDKVYRSEWLETNPSKTTESTPSPPFRFRQGVEISLFSTEAPCGDASMELVIAAAETAGQDISPWPTGAEQEIPTTDAQGLPFGRGFFSKLGALRRKPARADAEISMSKSCTDKLMLKQFVGILNFPLDMFLESSPEAFLKRIVVYEDQYSEAGYSRAFGPEGRLHEILTAGEEDLRTSARFFEVCTLPFHFRRFEFEKHRGGLGTIRKNKVSNVTAQWIAAGEGQKDNAAVEVLVNGVKQGFKQFDEKERKGSVVCRRNMVRKAVELQKVLNETGIGAVVPELEIGMPCSYSELKSSPFKEHRDHLKQLVLAGLGGWPKDYLKDDFEIDLSSSSIQ